MSVRKLILALALAALALGLAFRSAHGRIEAAPLPWSEPTERYAPSYPSAAIARRIQGTVLVKAWVDREGRVRHVHVVRSIPALDAAAIASVRRWRFEPCVRRGRHVAGTRIVPVKFALR